MDNYWQRLVDDMLKGRYQQSLGAQNLMDLKSNKNKLTKGIRQYSTSGSRRCLSHKRAVFLGPKFAGIYLTPREVHCALLLLSGCTSRDAAVQMHLSPRTVEYYLGNIKSKLGVRRKAEVIAILLESDFLVNFRYIVDAKE